MADIWQQFHSLPKAIRDGVSTPKAIQAIDDLEAQYPGADLANIIMRVVVHEFPVAELQQHISTECNVDTAAAKQMYDRLVQDIFIGDIAEYLGMAKSAPTAPPPPAQPLTREPQPILPAPPVNLPIPPMTDSPVPLIPKVPPLIIRTSVPTPKTTDDLDPKTTLTTSAAAPISVSVSAPASPIGPVSPTTQYSDEDAKEIEAQVSRLKQLSNVNPNQDFDSIARRVLNEQNVASGDELLERRSVAIVKARLKGVRTSDETKDILSRDVKIGGLGLDPEIAASVAAAAETYAVELKARGMVREPEILPPTPPVPLPPVTQEKPEPKPPFRRDGETPTVVIPNNIVDPPRPSRPIVRPADIPLPPPLPTAVSRKPIVTPPPPQKSAEPMIQRSRGADRPTMTDVVRPASRSLGPAEEMRSMTLIEFRRLGQGAGEATQRLLEKFTHLQKESFAVWVEAVAGWRQSDVYQLYLMMGRESLEKAVPIAQVIAERTRLGQPYLSDHEFSYIADLNRHLQI